MGFFVCKTMRMCSHLLEKGFEIKGEEPDRNNPRFKVWFFESTPQVWAAVQAYTNREKTYLKEK